MSCGQPGSSSHATETQRDFGVLRTAGAAGALGSGPAAFGAAAGGNASVLSEGNAGAEGGEAGGIEHDASPLRIAATASVRPFDIDVPGMWLILLEALGALLLLVFIVWWTMFSGRRRGEPPGSEHDDNDAHER